MGAPRYGIFLLVFNLMSERNERVRYREREDIGNGKISDIREDIENGKISS